MNHLTSGALCEVVLQRACHSPFSSSRQVSMTVKFKISSSRGIATIAGAALFAFASRSACAQSNAWASVEQALGRSGALGPADVMKFSFPRRDLTVTVGDVQVRPALALGSWVAIKRGTDGHAMAMGDLVLTEPEVNPVVSALQEGGVDVTAIHNHLIGASPMTMYMHIRAQGTDVDIARAIRKALAASKTPLDTAPASPSAVFALDTTALVKALGYSGKISGGVFQIGVPRSERIMENGMEIPPSMGVATGINFQPTGGGKAAITGDIVLIGSEVPAVMRALRSGGVSVTALHSHMLDESPRLYFMHFWANDDALKLAHTLNAALVRTNSAKPKISDR
jgi:hypothetical protein